LNQTWANPRDILQEGLYAIEHQLSWFA